MHTRTKRQITILAGRGKYQEPEFHDGIIETIKYVPGAYDGVGFSLDYDPDREGWFYFEEHNPTSPVGPFESLAEAVDDQYRVFRK